MGGKGPAPDLYRSRRSSPARGDWKPLPDAGWQGETPPAPEGLLEVSRSTWQTWFKAWWAAHWTTDDLPGLRLVIRLYDRVARGDVRRLGELRQLMDSYGITPKGQQDRRWLRPEPTRQALAGTLADKERLHRLASAPGVPRARQRDTRDVLRAKIWKEASDG